MPYECHHMLAKITPRSMKTMPFPLNELLSGSLYYPASAFDGDPIAYMHHRFQSFVYVDFALPRTGFREEVAQRGFLGYHVVSSREISEQELTPSGWKPSMLPEPGDGDPNTYRDYQVAPYCEWVVLERDDDRPESHGPLRFSLLHLCADGVAAFDALYRANNCAPGALAIIQPGTGFGHNWTNFTDPSRILGRLILGNPAGRPEFLLHGGAGGRHFYEAPIWPEYTESLGFLGNTSIHLWRRIQSR